MSGHVLLFTLCTKRTKQTIILNILDAGSCVCVFKEGNNVKTNTPLNYLNASQKITQVFDHMGIYASYLFREG